MTFLKSLLMSRHKVEYNFACMHYSGRFPDIREVQEYGVRIIYAW